MTQTILRKYEGIATVYVPTKGTTETINQNAGFEQSLKYGDGTRAVLGAAAVQRAFSEGFTVEQILEWVYRVDAQVGPEAKKLLGI
jgi:hypothetical protein